MSKGRHNSSHYYNGETTSRHLRKWSKLKRGGKVISLKRLEKLLAKDR